MEMRVRRARLMDAELIAKFINQAKRPDDRIDAKQVQDRSGTVGFMLAETGSQVVGIIGWQAENLIVRVTDFLIWPAVDRIQAGRLMISAMEEAAQELQCEAALLFLPRQAPEHVVSFWQAFGYEQQRVEEMPKAWREAAQEARNAGETIVMKRLRQDRVMRPI
jgi:N-acetylglutamate synthase-like GNAT family acetyltransferase